MRIEFFFKTQSEFAGLVNFMLAYQQSSAGNIFHRFNLANKVKNDNLLDSAKNVLNIFPSSNVSIHYSLKYNSGKTVDESFNYFKGFLTKAEKLGVSEILVISGSGDKKAFNAVSCLEMLRDSDCCNTGVELAVAFNPYFPKEKDRVTEIQRLNKKLSTGIVTSIYLQFGSDIKLLEQGIVALKNAIDAYKKNKNMDMTKSIDDKNVINNKNMKYIENIKVIGSIMIPSKVLLARMKFRPWNGVFLSDEAFLNSVEIATSTVKEILSLYKMYDIEPLVETAFKTDKDANYILDLLANNCRESEKDIESEDNKSSSDNEKVNQVEMEEVNKKENIKNVKNNNTNDREVNNSKNTDTKTNNLSVPQQAIGVIKSKENKKSNTEDVVQSGLETREKRRKSNL